VEIGETLYVTDRQAWRDWLEAHHASKPEIWLAFYTKASGKPSIPYNYAVEEALCFGWIDSIVKKLGPESRAQRFTPRRPGSPMSEMNKARVRRLAEAGIISPSAMESLANILDEPYQVPADIEAALQADDRVAQLPGLSGELQAYSRRLNRWLTRRVRSVQAAPGLLREDDEAKQTLRHGAVSPGSIEPARLVRVVSASSVGRAQTAR
jgi:uncharacterized protein YdeI (YjbR/CyaY-like superfamily)